MNRPPMAFPAPKRERGVIGEDGMTLRDYFAAQALQGWLSGPCQGDVLDDYEEGSPEFRQHMAHVARTCYGYADALLTARECE